MLLKAALQGIPLYVPPSHKGATMFHIKLIVPNACSTVEGMVYTVSVYAFYIARNFCVFNGRYLEHDRLDTLSLFFFKICCS